MRILLITIGLCMAASICLAQTQVNISNAQPRLDDKGQIVDAHDGRIMRFGNKFYWYGTQYGNTNGFTTANKYVCYSSDDMVAWHEEGSLLADAPEGVYYRPHVIYNAKRKRYVLWFNWYPKLWNGQFGVATSKTPQGPFKIVNPDVQMANQSLGLGDFGLFIDDDQTAYISYNTIQDHQVSIEKLNDAYTGSTLENGGVISKHMEAGAMFKREGKYYLLTDYTCCFCNYGSGARVYISDNPIKGYQLRGNINRYAGKRSYALVDGIKKGNHFETIAKVKEQWQGIELQYNQAQNITGLQVDLFTGNRPENCGDVANPRVHPPFETPTFKMQAWVDYEWKEVAVNDTKAEMRALNQTLTLSIPSTETNRIRLVPTAFPFDKMHVAEVSAHTEGSKATALAYLIGPNMHQMPIIPAQQTFIMPLETAAGTEFIWMGDLWGSASDNVKGHDYQYWGAPLQFNADGIIAPLEWVDEWSLELKDQ
ncbi:MAG: family 43 glycosylhydrolase [Bacteroidota bacterium]